MADETPAPLSDAAGDAMAMLMPYQGAWVPVTVRDMLRERDARLAALEHDNAALREIVAAVADGLIANDAAPHWRYCL